MSGTTVFPGQRLTVSEPNDGEFGAFRFGRQFAMVYEDQYHSIPQQVRFVQAKAGQVTARELLPRLFWWQRRE